MPSRAGRPPTISLEQVVAASIELADEIGLAACTMRSVAERLGVTPMALYRHVRDKEHLLELLPDALLANVAGAVRRRRTGVTALQEIADGVRAALVAHPWATSLFQRPAPGPNMRAAAEHCIRLLVDEGASPGVAFRWLRAVVAQVIGEMLTAHGEFDPTGVRLLIDAIGTSLDGER